MNDNIFTGCIPALMTPCTKDRQPDFDALVAKGRELIEAGMDVARLNLSHGTLEDSLERFHRLRAVSEAVGKPIGIMADLPGPKVRLGKFEETVELDVGAELLLQPGNDTSTAKRLFVDYDTLLTDVMPGDRRHQGQAGGLDPCFHRRLAFRRVRDAARAAAHDHPGIVARIEPLGEVFAIKPDAVHPVGREVALGEEGGKFVVAGLGLGAQLQDQETAHAQGFSPPRPIRKAQM